MITKSTLQKCFSTFISDKRDRLGITQEQLAENVSTSLRWIQRIEAGTSLPGFCLATRIIIYLEIDVTELISVLTAKSYHKQPMLYPLLRFRFRVVKERLYHPELRRYYTTYAVAAEQQYIKDHENAEILVHDVTLDQAFAEQLCSMCTRSQLDPIHLIDVIFDSFAWTS